MQNLYGAFLAILIFGSQMELHVDMVIPRRIIIKENENEKINFPFLDFHFPLFLTGGVITQIAGNIVL